MRKHPSLQDVIHNRCSYEWLELALSGFFLGDLVDSENAKGDVSSPCFHLFAETSQSEYGRYCFENITIAIEPTQADDLQNLEGTHPLGGINYYEANCVFITVNVTPKFVDNLISLISDNLDNLSLKVAIPIWVNTEAKFLPLLKYELIYRQQSQNEPIED